MAVQPSQSPHDACWAASVSCQPSLPIRGRLPAVRAHHKADTMTTTAKAQCATSMARLTRTTYAVRGEPGRRGCRCVRPPGRARLSATPYNGGEAPCPGDATEQDRSHWSRRVGSRFLASRRHGWATQRAGSHRPPAPPPSWPATDASIQTSSSGGVRSGRVAGARRACAPRARSGWPSDYVARTWRVGPNGARRAVRLLADRWSLSPWSRVPMLNTHSRCPRLRPRPGWCRLSERQ
jgi:hypothetical protein